MNSIVINCLALLGAVLYIGFRCAPTLPLAGPEMVIKELAFTLLFVIQELRGLVTLTMPGAMPAWLEIKKLDRRFAADSTVLYLICFGLLELTVRRYLDPVSTLYPPVLLWPTTVMEVGLGLAILILSSRRHNSNIALGLGAVLVFALIFLSPLIVVGGLAYGMYKLMDLHSQRDYEALGVAALSPIMIASFILIMKDKRDRLQNTWRVIVNQFIALPAVPAVFMLLKYFWPEKISVMVLPAVVILLMYAPLVLARRTRPWLVRERIESLLAQQEQFSGSEKLPQAADFEDEVRAVFRDLDEKRLVLKNAGDHVDRGDAYWKYGELLTGLGRYEVAEASYIKAVASYNHALTMEDSNKAAIAHKFKTVEAMGELKMLMMKNSVEAGENS